MNYLAHIFLSRDDSSLMLGNMITDFSTRAELQALPGREKAGVRLHRKIDQLTDSHEIFIKHKRLLYPYFSKYSPVVLDILYDYLLESNWHLLTDESFDDFESRVYDRLLSVRTNAPERVAGIVERMVDDRWLRHYTDRDGLVKVFNRLERKISFPQSFSAFDEVLDRFENEWLPEHYSFFSEIREELAELSFEVK